MARSPRYPCKVEAWTTEEQSARIDRLDTSGLMSRADHLRKAYEMYLDYNGIHRLRPAPPVNGHQHPASAEHA